MRRIWCIGFLLAAVFMAACNSNKQVPEPAVPEDPRRVEGPSKELAAIDSLLWQRPDSALACLIPYFDTCCRDGVHTVSTYNHHYAHLLLAELLYKNDYAQTNRAKLRQAVGYFDSLYCRDAARHVSTFPTTAFLDARAHYINGVGYYEHDSVVPACKEYLKALEVMEEHFEEKELVGKKAKFMALSYTHLSGLFSDMYLHEQAIYYGKWALHYYNKYEASPIHTAWVLDEIGLHYDILENYDSADYYYKKGVKILSDTNSSTYRDIATHLAFLSYKKGNFVTSLKHLQTIKAQAESVNEYTSRCLTIGEIYYHEHQFDSAWLYLNLVYNKSQNIGSKKQAAEWLAEITKIQGRNTEVLEYTSFLVPFANVEENQSGTKSQLTTLYNESKQNRLDYQHQKETRKHIRTGAIVFGGLILVIVFLFWRSIKHKKSLETERHAHKIQQAALAGRLKRSNADLKEQEKRQAAISSHLSHQHQKSSEEYANEPICKTILALCNDNCTPIKSTIPVSAYAHLALSDIQTAQLKDAAMRHYGLLFETMKQQHQELKEKDFYYCYLCLLGLDNIQIAVLQQKSISTIWDRENRLKKIFESDEKVSVILYELINNQLSGC